MLLSALSLGGADFGAWMNEHAKSYPDAAAEARALATFQENSARYDTMNRQNPHATYGPDRFSDMSHGELLRSRTGYVGYNGPARWQNYSGADKAEIARALAASPEIDWRKKGAVTPAKDQGAYGTCWAFGASAVIEGINVAQASRPLVSLCEQEWIDCCPKCQGRSPDVALDYLIDNQNGFLDTEASYPYKGAPQGTCEAAQHEHVASSVSSWKLMHQDKDGNQDGLLAEMVKSGPCNIGVDASCLSGYKSGIITGCPGKGVDHANVIVGAGTDGGVDYFIAKNSWGHLRRESTSHSAGLAPPSLPSGRLRPFAPRCRSTWGDDGFYKFERNTGQLKVDACWYAYTNTTGGARLAGAERDLVYKRAPPGAIEAEERAQSAPLIPFQLFSEGYVKKALADGVDWRQKGRVTEVKDQGPHGYCGTFGRVGSAEGQWARKGGSLTSFSEEMLVDCIGWDKA